MNTYRREMEKIKLGSEAKRRVLELYPDAGQREERKQMKAKYFVKPAVAVAACAAVLTGFVVSGNLSLKRAQSESAASGSEADAANAGSDHSFTILANAAELSEDVPVVADGGSADPSAEVSTDSQNGWVISGTEDSEEVSYALGTRFQVEGEGIASVTYQINRGYFQFVYEEGELPISDMVEEDGGSLPIVGGAYEEEEENQPAILTKTVSEYTVPYDDQLPEGVSVNVCGSKSIAHKDALFSGDASTEETQEAQQELIGDLVITCTVNFADGTAMSREIAVKSEILTEQEANPDILDSPNPEDVELVVLNRKSAWITFSLQEQ